jgi:hypothetical protein
MRVAVGGEMLVRGGRAGGGGREGVPAGVQGAGGAAPCGVPEGFRACSGGRAV